MPHDKFKHRTGAQFSTHCLQITTIILRMIFLNRSNGRQH